MLRIGMTFPTGHTLLHAVTVYSGERQNGAIILVQREDQYVTGWVTQRDVDSVELAWNWNNGSYYRVRESDDQINNAGSRALLSMLRRANLLDAVSELQRTPVAEEAPTTVLGMFFARQQIEERQQDERVVWDEWKQRYTWVEDTSLQHVDRRIYRSQSLLQSGGDMKGPRGFEEIEEWTDYPYRRVWVNFAQHIILTFTEGDLTYETPREDVFFSQLMLRADAFYAYLNS